MAPDISSLTYLLDQWLSVFGAGRAAILPNALALLATIAAIEITIAALWAAYDGGDALKMLIQKSLIIGFFYWVVTNFEWLSTLIIKGFIDTGVRAGGGSAPTLTDPSAIVQAGFTATNPVFAHIATYTGWDVMFNLADVAISGLCGLLIIGAFIILAIQVFMTYIEFGIVSTLGMILLPFGVSRHTSFLAEKVIGSIISFGVKLMVLAFIVAVTVPLLSSFTLPTDPTWNDLFAMVMVSLAIMGLAWHAPGVAAGMISGGPSLTAGTAATTALAAGAGAVGMGMAGSGAARALDGAGVVATKAAASAVDRVPGLRELIKDSPAAVGKAREELARTYGNGNSPDANEQKGRLTQKLQTAHHLAQATIPRESTPSGGTSVPIKHDS